MGQIDRNPAFGHAGTSKCMKITAVISMGEALVFAVRTDAIVSYQGQDYIFVLINEAPGNHDAKSDHSKGQQKRKLK